MKTNREKTRNVNDSTLRMAIGLLLLIPMLIILTIGMIYFYLEGKLCNPKKQSMPSPTCS